jgi:hypothetical protein
MDILNRPYATTKQFRAAVKRVMSRVGSHSYTDCPVGQRGGKDVGKRYVTLRSKPTQSEIEAIEFILWSQGVTANTRSGAGGVYIRGTCILAKDKQNG